MDAVISKMLCRLAMADVWGIIAQTLINSDVNQPLSVGGAGILNSNTA
jgi:hypothetical protein